MNHERDEFSHWRTPRELRGHLHAEEHSPDFAWYAAGAVCAVLILAALAMFL